MSGNFAGVRWGGRVAVVVLGLAMFMAAVSVFAQLPTGTILGTVKDPSGAVVLRATITVHNLENGTTRSVSTDDRGAYRLSALPVGHYD